MPPTRILECVPNFSEGRRHDVIDKIASSAQVGGVQVLDIHSDPDLNRSVLTLVGSPRSLIDAALSVTAVAMDSIDLRKHEGQHPRIGSMDVIPFVPLTESDMHEAIDAAVTCGQRIGEELGIPCFLYEFAALRRHARALELPAVRANAFELLAPDFGPSDPHPTAGGTAVGARRILVAFNIEIEGADLDTGKKIAASVRESGGGLDHLRSLAFYLKSRNRVVISMNLTRPELTTIADVFEAITEVASGMDLRVAGSELVGLAPRAAFGGRSPADLGLSVPKILEDEIRARFP